MTRTWLGLWSVVWVALGACTPSGGGTSSSGSSSGGGADAAVLRDAGPPDAADGPDVPRVDAGPGCGTLTESGLCDGNTLRYCRNRTIVETDCASRGRTCALQTDLGGFWCVGALGSVCETNDTDVCSTGVTCVLGVCGGPQPDAGAPDAAVVPSDGGARDASVADASPVPDAAPVDAAVVDASVAVDAAVVVDASVRDAAAAADAAVMPTDAAVSDAR